MCDSRKIADGSSLLINLLSADYRAWRISRFTCPESWPRVHQPSYSVGGVRRRRGMRLISANWFPCRRSRPSFPAAASCALTPLLVTHRRYSASSGIVPCAGGRLGAARSVAASGSDRVPGRRRAVRKLTDCKLLNNYQASRLRVGKDFGLMLGNYRVLDRIGAGGMGVIYLAEHIRMRRRVAIKTLTFTEDQDERLRLRFDAEMRAVAQLRHQNIVSPIDFGEEHSPNPDIGSLHYFVMEYLPGEDLEALVHSKGPLTSHRACRLAHQVADALNEAHSHQLIHRDIKPSNILVTPEGSAKLLDFGLARSARARLTEPGSVLGTLGYMAPEQARDATTVDERADIYSLGATLFWALTGQDPFPLTSNVAQDLNLRLTQPPPSARSIRPEVPARLDDIVAKMMAIDPADRYSTAEAVMRASAAHRGAQPCGADSPPRGGCRQSDRCSPGAAAGPAPHLGGGR